MDKAQLRKLFSESMRKDEKAEPESMEDILVLRLTGLTSDQIRELKERDIAKVPDDTDDEYDMYVCPSCNMAIGTIGDKKEHHFCLNCGQRIKWEERRC